MEDNNYNTIPEQNPNDQTGYSPVENLTLDPYGNQAEIEQAKDEVTAQSPAAAEPAAPQDVQQPIYTQQPQDVQQPPMGGAPMMNGQPPVEQKSKLAAGLLGIFLGAFGVHNFYLGKIGLAVAQLLITVLSCGILGVVSEIWGLIEGIMILTGSINVDGKGIPLKD